MMPSMSIIEELKEENDKAYVTWFESWWKNLDLMNKIRESNRMGYTAYRLTHDADHTDKHKYNRLADKRIIKLIQEKLEPGIRLSIDNRNEEGSLFDLVHYRKTYLDIRFDWGYEE